MGPDPVADKVIATGDPLFGSTVTGLFLYSESLNNNGQIAFVANLANGKEVVVRADPGATDHLVVTGQPPANVFPGNQFDVQVSVENANGIVDPTFTGNVTIGVNNPGANPGGGTLGGTLSLPVFNGEANFYNLTLNKPGTGYTLQATSAAGSAMTFPFNVFGDYLVVTAQPPATVVAGKQFDVQVSAENANGIVDPNFTGNVTIGVNNPGTNPGGGTLGGTTSITITNGMGLFDFNNLTLNQPGTGYTLQATSGTAGSVTTNPFNVLGLYIWTGDGSNNLWSNPDNWSGDSVPTAGVDLIFPADALQETNVNDLGIAFNSITTADTYSFSGQALVISVLNVNQGSLQLGSDVTVTGTLSVATGAALTVAANANLSCATLDDEGNLTVAANATLVNNKSMTVGTSGTLDDEGNLIVAANANLADNNSVTVGTSGTLDDEGSLTIATSASLVNNNSVTVGIGGMLDDEGSLTIAANASLVDNNSVTVGTSGTLDDEGFLIVTAATDVAPNASLVDNNSVTVGTSGTWDDEGSLTVAADATLSLEGRLIAGTSATLQDAGSLTITSDGAVDDFGVVNVANGGTLTVRQGLLLVGSNASLSDSGNLTVDGDASLGVEGGLTVTDDGSLVVQGVVSIGEGAALDVNNSSLVVGVSGVVDNTSNLVIGANGSFSLGGSLALTGTASGENDAGDAFGTTPITPTTPASTALAEQVDQTTEVIALGSETIEKMAQTVLKGLPLDIAETQAANQLASWAGKANYFTMAAEYAADASPILTAYNTNDQTGFANGYNQLIKDISTDIVGKIAGSIAVHPSRAYLL